MKQPRITAKITFLGPAEGGRDELPANLSSGQYRPHVVIDPNQLRAVTVDSVPEETYFGITLVNGPAQILPRQSFLADLVLMYWPNIKYEGLSPGVTFTIREGPHTVGYGRVESVLTNGVI
jgi:translation elongation factor EF-Tu-like GTPase